MGSALLLATNQVNTHDIVTGYDLDYRLGLLPVQWTRT